MGANRRNPHSHGSSYRIDAGGKPRFLSYHTTWEDASQLLGRLSNYSMYTLEEELKQGYITISGGHRVGLAGKVIVENGFVKGLRDISSFNIRIAKEKIGIALPFLPYLYEEHWHNTLIIGPPQTGKTTLLRDIARLASTGTKTILLEKQALLMSVLKSLDVSEGCRSTILATGLMYSMRVQRLKG